MEHAEEYYLEDGNGSVGGCTEVSEDVLENELLEEDADERFNC